MAMWLTIAASVCVLGFMVGVCRACCTACHKLCTPETNPTGSITVTLPALTTNGLGCGACATFGDTYILDRVDPNVFGSTGCAPASFIDACYWGLDVSPIVCTGISVQETLLLSLSGNDGGINGYEIRLDLCFYLGGGFREGITWIDLFSEPLPFDCDDLNTRTLPYLSTGGFSLCTTSDDASVTF